MKIHYEGYFYRIEKFALENAKKEFLNNFEISENFIFYLHSVSEQQSTSLNMHYFKKDTPADVITVPLYRNFDESLKKKINFLGSLVFGIPLCYFLIFKGYNYFIRSFLIDENSKETGGLPNLFILKFFIFTMGLLLFIEIVNKIRKFISKI